MVNNAATIAIGPIAETTTETWNRVMAVNLRGVFLGCREAARQMIAQGTGAGSSTRRPGRAGVATRSSAHTRRASSA
jgi:NAD(P)-dependent dehydrogenase (short-subunit alcohol dehydrogenase family)